MFDNKNSSTVRFAVDSICKGVPLSSQLKALKPNREVIDYVARTPDAIGIIGVNWLSDRNDSTGLSFSKEVRLMSVSAADKAMPDNSYKPYQAYLYYGDYPLARSIYALLNDPRSTSVGICLFPRFRPGTADYIEVRIGPRHPTGARGERQG